MQGATSSKPYRCRPTSSKSSPGSSPCIMSNVPSSSASGISMRPSGQGRDRPMSESNNFILRWARLKHESDTTHEADLGGNSAPPDPGRTPAAGATDAFPSSDAAIDQPFDLASLPSIESIAADTDIVAFLR